LCSTQLVLIYRLLQNTYSVNAAVQDKALSYEKHTQRHTVSHSVQTNERSVTLSASTLFQVPGLSTHTVTALFTQVPWHCATSHHMFQVCVNTGSCLYNKVNYRHAARGRGTYFSLVPHELSPSTTAQRQKKASSRIGGKTWLI